ncbi:hypothetical protein [Agromyces sp. LHK192]|uniref:hypothetical protein n=1 Tax=Agromyces sp. LHK192 TaxID=2498704 RepID=UPI000FDC1EF4|nr:hypothetical protein [Agromyces sp. LHK192]
MTTGTASVEATSLAERIDRLERLAIGWIVALSTICIGLGLILPTGTDRSDERSWSLLGLLVEFGPAVSSGDDDGVLLGVALIVGVIVIASTAFFGLIIAGRRPSPRAATVFRAGAGASAAMCLGLWMIAGFATSNGSTLEAGMPVLTVGVLLLLVYAFAPLYVQIWKR